MSITKFSNSIMSLFKNMLTFKLSTKWISRLNNDVICWSFFVSNMWISHITYFQLSYRLISKSRILYRRKFEIYVKTRTFKKWYQLIKYVEHVEQKHTQRWMNEKETCREIENWKCFRQSLFVVLSRLYQNIEISHVSWIVLECLYWLTS